MMIEDWNVFLAPYKQAVDELKVKLKGMREQFDMQFTHSPIEFVTGRVKPVPSILDKAKRKNIPLDTLGESMQDIAGLRMMCQFVDDIQHVKNLIHNRNDFEIMEERDYVNDEKDSGYRSHHIVIRYPVQTIQGEKMILVEIQIRTLAMNFWATIEHSLKYKYSGQIPENIQLRLKRAAQAAFLLDEEMSLIREEIREAQQMFKNKEEGKSS